ncbi:MAG: rod shape-determining protein MreC [Candidatus Eremiobacteraeota bacterium]|nr:rod shape-determining protein MreC [Candidatus Eremiobacteraeota bacterium]
MTIFSYRDERRLFTLIGIIIAAALLALLQISAQRSGATSPISAVAGSVIEIGETGVAIAIRDARVFGSNVLALPSLERQNAQLRARNLALIEENARLHELAAADAAESRTQPIVDLYHGVEARVVGFPPENESRAVTIDKGYRAGVRRDDGVLAADGVVGRVASAGPFSSSVVLVTDYTSRIPAIVQRGRWWGIARGNLGSVLVEYIPQDAPLRAGDVVVTGEGRSFHSGVPIGVVKSIERGDATLYQTAVLKTAVDLGSLDRVVVVTR